MVFGAARRVQDVICFLNKIWFSCCQYRTYSLLLNLVIFLVSNVFVEYFLYFCSTRDVFSSSRIAVSKIVFALDVGRHKESAGRTNDLIDGLIGHDRSRRALGGKNGMENAGSERILFEFNRTLLL